MKNLSIQTFALALFVVFSGGDCEGQIVENPAELVSQDTFLYLCPASVGIGEFDVLS